MCKRRRKKCKFLCYSIPSGHLGVSRDIGGLWARVRKTRQRRRRQETRKEIIENVDWLKLKTIGDGQKPRWVLLKLFLLLFRLFAALYAKILSTHRRATAYLAVATMTCYLLALLIDFLTGDLFHWRTWWWQVPDMPATGPRMRAVRYLFSHQLRYTDTRIPAV